VKGELAKRGAVVRYQLFMDPKGERAYLFDPERGQVLAASLKPGTSDWTISVRAARD
jgi:hypothetical protein